MLTGLRFAIKTTRLAVGVQDLPKHDGFVCTMPTERRSTRRTSTRASGFRCLAYALTKPNRRCVCWPK
jgi:hypothetical protein